VLGKALDFIVYYLYNLLNLGGWQMFIACMHFEIVIRPTNFFVSGVSLVFILVVL